MKLFTKKKKAEKASYEASQSELVWRRFRKHRVAFWCLHIVVLLYVVCLNSHFFAPYSPDRVFAQRANQPPQPLRFGMVEGSRLPRLYVYPLIKHKDPVTLVRIYQEDRASRQPLHFFVKGRTWKLLGLLPMERHFFGAAQGQDEIFLLGTGMLGQDTFSRVLYGGRISLLLGLTGVLITFFLGILLGGISGYYGGKVDMLIQRVAEVLQSLPKVPLWLALGATIPKDWTSLQVYFGMTMILACMGWTGLCRTVRGKLLSLREEDYARAAMIAGASETRIIFKHLIPNFTSHIIAQLTLSIPGMILAETGLSFLGLGLQPPMVSWGILLQNVRSPGAIANQPWLLMPALAVVLAVLAMNFVGEGLRDAADPYAN